MRSLTIEQAEKVSGGNGLPFPFLPAPIGHVILIGLIVDGVGAWVEGNTQNQSTNTDYGRNVT